MFSLNQNWITESHIDFEYKKYMVLAYLQEVEHCLTESKLFPVISDLKKHHRNLLLLKSQKESVDNSFPKQLEGINFTTLALNYQSATNDDKVMATLQSIIDFSLPLFQQYLNQGNKIARFVEDHLCITPVGIMPIRTCEGYVLITCKGLRTIEVYQYVVSLYDDVNNQFPSIKFNYKSTYEYSLSNTFEKIKQDLILKQQQFPNPAAFCITSDFQFPLMETLLPLAKISLSKHLSLNTN